MRSMLLQEDAQQKKQEQLPSLIESLLPVYQFQVTNPAFALIVKLKINTITDVLYDVTQQVTTLDTTIG